MKKLLLLAILGGLFLSPALADRPIDETVAAEPDGEVSIELIAGSIHVIGWDRDEVQVTGSVGDDVEEVEVSSSRGRVTIEVKLPDHDDDHDGKHGSSHHHGDGDSDDDSSGRSRTFHDADAELEIHVPADSLVEVEGISADIVIEKVQGEVDLESISGDVEIDGPTREIEAASVSGDVVLNATEPLEEGEFESVSGDIDVRASLAPGGDFSFETVSGNIKLRLPGDTSAEFEIDTFSGAIQNEFGPEPKRDRQLKGASSLEFSTGGGDAYVEIESFSGKIQLLID